MPLWSFTSARVYSPVTSFTFQFSITLMIKFTIYSKILNYLAANSTLIIFRYFAYAFLYNTRADDITI